MRLIKADWIYPSHRAPIKNGAIRIDEEGKVLELLEVCNEEAEYYEGILCPGFINVHCHLELSFAYQQIMQKTGIDSFINELEMAKRSFTPDIQLEAIAWADQQMKHNGIVAVGDIMNTPFSLDTKMTSSIRYHNFIESYGSDASLANQRYALAEGLMQAAGPYTSLVPHAPYSSSVELFEMIYKAAYSVQSIHYAESKAEYTYFEKGEGKIFDRLKKWGVKIPDFIPSGRSPILSIEKWLRKDLPLLLIHNTFITEEDIAFITSIFDKAFFGLCPNANLYIEDTLPPEYLLKNKNVTMCIGTDSLASNHSLSILSEIQVLKSHFPDLEDQELLRWATLNGAAALGMDKDLGSFEEGKKPGILLIDQEWKNVRVLV